MPSASSPSYDPLRPLPGDRATAPAALELDSPSAWDEFERLQKEAASPAAPTREELAFAPTQPAAMPSAAGAARPAPARTARAPLTLQELLVEARRFNRVCPKPPAWQRLHDLLAAAGPARRGVPQPLSGRAWQETGAMQKRMCLRDQLEWAEEHGLLAQAMDFFKGLDESEWLHVED